METMETFIIIFAAGALFVGVVVLMLKKSPDRPEPEPIEAVVKAVHYSPYIEGIISDQSAYYEVIARDAAGHTYRDLRRDPMIVGDRVRIYRYADFDCWVLSHG